MPLLGRQAGRGLTHVTIRAGVAGARRTFLGSVQGAAPAPELGLHGLSHALVIFVHGQQLGLY
jgi:hypothetical protein